jgi:hypothetical protein
MRMCLALLQAVQLVPALPTRLLPMLVQNMPHKLRDRSAQCLYLSAVIALCEGKVGPALREGLLSGLVEHLLSIDADIRWEDIVDAPTGMGARMGAALLLLSLCQTCVVSVGECFSEFGWAPTDADRQAPKCDKGDMRSVVVVG